MPPVRIQDNMQLPANTYVIKVKEVEIARGDIRPDMLLVMDPAGNKITLPGEVRPHRGAHLRPARVMWVTRKLPRGKRCFATIGTVVDPPTVVTTHLTRKPSKTTWRTCSPIPRRRSCSTIWARKNRS